MDIDRASPNIYWKCPFCGEKHNFPQEAQGHLIDQHSPTDTTANTQLMYLLLPGIGDEEDKRGVRIRHWCPFCEVPPEHYAHYKTKAQLKSHLTSAHGCS